jgi:AraC family transcriptional regulator
VTDFSDLPREFSRVRIPEQKYAVFAHSDHISTIRRTISTIWNQWLPASGMKAADAPNFERYDEQFDPLTGNGGLEIWIRWGSRAAGKTGFHFSGSCSNAAHRAS